MSGTDAKSVLLLADKHPGDIVRALDSIAAVNADDDALDAGDETSFPLIIRAEVVGEVTGDVRRLPGGGAQ